jgi:hypothetical protein
LVFRTHDEAEAALEEALAAAKSAARAAHARLGDRDTCGSARVSIYPARGKLVTVLKRRGIGRSLQGYGYLIWASELHDVNLSQSITVHEKAAKAFAAVLSKHGVKAYSGAAMD